MAIEERYRILFLISLSVVSFTSAASIINCPVNCNCFWNLDSLVGDCSNSGLIEPPQIYEIPIEHLVLSHNHIAQFPKHLSEITSLIFLDLSDNQIEVINEDDLLGFVALRSLILTNNKISNWLDMNPNEAFKNTINLKHLSLSGNSLGSFTDANPKEIIVSQSLKELELENCGITAVGGDVLINGLPNLEYLKLTKNALTSIDFLPSKSLRKLDISDTKLKNVQNLLLQGLPHLENLNLSVNIGLELGDRGNGNLFSQSLVNLDVSYCGLNDFDISGFPSLQTIILRNNMLLSIKSDQFMNNTLLENIDLSRNSLRLIEAQAFTTLEHLRSLDLSYNAFNHIDPNLVRSNNDLVTVNLNNNEFEKMPKLISNSLRALDFSSCRIFHIDDRSISGLTSIKYLDLSHNSLSIFPSSIRSETLKELDLSFNRITFIRNTTFNGFPELISLHLNGNSLTVPDLHQYFKSNKYLVNIWIGENPWICDCSDDRFMSSYEYFQKYRSTIRDKYKVRCGSPPDVYGKTWDDACFDMWTPSSRSTKAEQVWTTIMVSLLVVGALIFLFSCFQRLLKSRKERQNEREFQRNNEEMHEIRRLNQRILQEEPSTQGPSAFELTTLPSYEDALRMPKLHKPAKSMVDLTATERNRNRLKKAHTSPEEDDDDLLIDRKNRFHSVEMLANREKERKAYIMPNRRTDFIVDSISFNNRQLSIEATRFPSSFVKSQNLQSAEKLGNFQSYENSPYCKRRQKIAEIPPFKRATLQANSVEFLTDPEFEAQSKPSSPFARRKPKLSEAQDAMYRPLEPIEDHFGAVQKSRSSSSAGSDFQLVVEPELAPKPKFIYNSSSGDDENENTSGHANQGKRKKLKNSSSRRASGNFSSGNIGHDSSSSEQEPMVIVHKPMRETLF